MNHTFVNHKGEPINMEALAKKHKPPKKTVAVAMRRVDDRANAKVSDGFVVTGFSPDHLAEVKKDHEKKRDGQIGRELEPKESLSGHGMRKPTCEPISQSACAASPMR